MAKKRIAINGFGRIGRLTYRNLLLDENVEVVAINDLTDNHTLAHLLKFDSAHGRLNADISATDDHIIVNGNKIQATAERDPAKLNWAELNIDTVLECTGFFRTKEKAALHVQAGAKKVIISAPAKGDGVTTVVLGVNTEASETDNTVMSNASCTTNCLAPVVKVIDENFGFVQGSLTTTHAYTSDQKIQDAPHSDLRRARAAAYNIVPTTTGAANAVGKVYPKVAGKMFAIAVRVPVITGSMIELNVLVEKEVTAEQINEAFQKASSSHLKGVMEYSTDPLVSSDIVGNKHSCIFDSLMTQSMGKMIKVVAWYDNEAGYSARLADLAARI
jgi:glyceraldehyde 3-phosphate dehydrogenase